MEDVNGSKKDLSASAGKTAHDEHMQRIELRDFFKARITTLTTHFAPSVFAQFTSLIFVTSL